jgi:hypothetical protein
MKAVGIATALAVALLSGCLAEMQEDARRATSACDLLGDPGQTPRAAPAEGGPGPRRLAVTLPEDGAGSGVAVVAWWQAGPDAVQVVRLRTSESRMATFLVPADAPIGLLAGGSEWTSEGRVAAGAAPATLLLGSGLEVGSIEGAWGMPAAQGLSGASWQPEDLPFGDGDRMERLERLDLLLSWTNGPQGGADFGIAVGPNGGSGFHYTNREYQTSLGPQTESRVLEAADLGQLGWDASTRPQAGPSVSTGGFAVAPIAYTLDWTATFAADPELADRCLDLGDADAADVTSGSQATSGSAASLARPAGPRRAD